MSKSTHSDGGHDVREIELEIEGETFRAGGSKGRRLVPTIVDGDQEAERWLEAAEDVIDNLRTGEGIKRRLDEEGDRLTLGELLDRNDIDVEDLAHQRWLDRFDPAEELSTGDIVEIRQLHNGDPQEPKRGVVQDIQEGYLVKVGWKGGAYSLLKNEDDELRIGRAAMGLGFGLVYDISIVDPDEDAVDEELLEMRKNALESAVIDEKATEYDVDVVSKWSESSGTVASSSATDLHARVSVDGPNLEEPVEVHCRNVFDFGWTATVEDDVDDELEAIIIQAARNNSPISTGPRL